MALNMAMRNKDRERSAGRRCRKSSDVTAPSISKAEYSQAGVLTIYFSERVTGNMSLRFVFNNVTTAGGETLSVSGSGSTRTSSPATAVSAGDTLTLTYNTAETVIDAAGNLLPQTSDFPITNLKV